MKIYKSLVSAAISLATLATSAQEASSGVGRHGPDKSGVSIPVQVDRSLRNYELYQATNECSYIINESILSQIFRRKPTSSQISFAKNYISAYFSKINSDDEIYRIYVESHYSFTISELNDIKKEYIEQHLNSKYSQFNSISEIIDTKIRITVWRILHPEKRYSSYQNENQKKKEIDDFKRNKENSFVVSEQQFQALTNKDFMGDLSYQFFGGLALIHKTEPVVDELGGHLYYKTIKSASFSKTTIYRVAEYSLENNKYWQIKSSPTNLEINVEDYAQCIHDQLN